MSLQQQWKWIKSWVSDKRCRAWLMLINKGWPAVGEADKCRLKCYARSDINLPTYRRSLGRTITSPTMSAGKDSRPQNPELDEVLRKLMFWHKWFYGCYVYSLSMLCFMTQSHYSKKRTTSSFSLGKLSAISRWFFCCKYCSYQLRPTVWHPWPLADFLFAKWLNGR